MELVEEGQNQAKIAPKPIKYQEIVEKRDEDRISVVPENMLIKILSRLPYTKMPSNSTLSKRWNHLWTSIPTLSFKNTVYDRPLSDFFSFVDKTLTQCCQLKLKKFKLYTRYDIGFESQINNWIRYAISCNVEELTLWLYCIPLEAKFQPDQFLYISSCLTDPTLEGCMLNPIGAISWKNLRSLCIINGKLDEALIENILAGSPLLETLELNTCYGYRRLDITSKRVKKLVFSGYVNPSNVVGDDVIEINAPYILSITIEDDLDLWKLLLVNVSALVEANLDYTFLGYWDPTLEEIEEEILEEILLNLGHVKDLNIDVSFSEVLSRLEAKGFNFPTNMKVSHRYS